jgi:hypothetical protein
LLSKYLSVAAFLITEELATAKLQLYFFAADWQISHDPLIMTVYMPAG